MSKPHRYPMTTQIRLPRTLADWLDRVHERTRIPKSEIHRFALSLLHDRYTGPRGKLLHDELVTDLVEDLHERGLVTRRGHTKGTDAAA